MEREPAKRIGGHHTSDVKALGPSYSASMKQLQWKLVTMQGHVFFADVDFAQLMRREAIAASRARHFVRCFRPAGATAGGASIGRTLAFLEQVSVPKAVIEKLSSDVSPPSQIMANVFWKDLLLLRA